MDYAKHLDPHYDALRLISQHPLTFDAINQVDHITSTVIAMTDLWAADPDTYKPFVDSDYASHSRLHSAIHAAEHRLAAEKQSLPLHQRLEQHLFSLLSQIAPVEGIALDSTDEVLFSYTGSYCTSPALRCYLVSCEVYGDSDSYVLQVPRWLHAALCSPFAFAHIDQPGGERLAAHALCERKGHAFPIPAVAVPSPDILESALKLWSGDSQDLYFDIATAIDAATRLN